MRRWTKRIAITLAIVLIVGSIASYWAVQQTKVVPEFYAKATNLLPVQTREASERLQHDVEKFQSDVGRLGSWSAAFSDAEINAWLIEELPKRFPRLLAKGMNDPRIVIEDDCVLVAARYQDRRFDTIISFEVEVELTEEANMLALRLKNLRAGALPMPLNKFLKGITREAARGDVDVKWDMTQAGPIALVNVPREHPGYVASPVIVESVRLVDGVLLLAGHTGSLAEQVFTPRGPVHQFVSYNPRRNRQESTAIR
ncbi:hypothetical protein [Planctomycetes bacterium K23_9]|uniref:Uncharacterized protein n=1 Tax=Stieleria marina TaxID=1930275 RepID=A0A517P2Z4_9BACT|nr:hypothetical protein K239x_57610 [Planctomycetes bacterium K23_9]